MRGHAKLWWLMAMVIAGLLFVAACDGDSDTTDGDTDGDTPSDGDVPCDKIDATCADTVSGTTSGAGALNGYTNVEWDMSGGELIYEVPINEDESYVLRVEEISADFEADYFILRECDKATTVVDYGDKFASACLEPGVYYIVIDGRNGENGNVEARITCAPCDNMDGDEDSPDGDFPDGDFPDGDEPDGDEPDGDTPDGDYPDGDMDGDVDGDATDGDVDGDATDGDVDDDMTDGDVDGDSEGGGLCGCACSGTDCSGSPAGTSFTSSGCDGWTDDTLCSGWISVVCADLCGDSTTCWDTCEADMHGSAPPTYSDGTAITGYDCTITIHCP